MAVSDSIRTGRNLEKKKPFQFDFSKILSHGQGEGGPSSYINANFEKPTCLRVKRVFSVMASPDAPAFGGLGATSGAMLFTSQNIMEH